MPPGLNAGGSGQGPFLPFQPLLQEPLKATSENCQCDQCPTGREQSGTRQTWANSLQYDKLLGRQVELDIARAIRGLLHRHAAGRAEQEAHPITRGVQRSIH